jgi:hypothetical protein
MKIILAILITVSAIVYGPVDTLAGTVLVGIVIGLLDS